MCTDLYHSRLLLFIEISIKVPQLQQNVPIMMRNLITFGRIGKISPNDFYKSVANCLYTIFLKEYIKISIYSWPNVVALQLAKLNGWK